jgi:hypothetical protein
MEVLPNMRQLSKSKKAIALGAAALVLLLAVTGCKNANKDDVTASASAPASAASSASADPNASPVNASPSAAPETTEQTGEYVGQIDGHSIEIKTDKGSVAYQVSPEISDQVSSWDEGTKVKFQSSEIALDGSDTKQLTITKIEKQ